MEQEMKHRHKKQDFQNGKIYIIRNSVNDQIYIGSTCQSLSQRMVHHRRDTNTQRCQEFNLYKAMKELHKNTFYIALLEHYPCNTRDDLNKKDGEYIRKYHNQLNRQIAGRTDKEYREDNKTKAKEYHKEYQQNNKETLAEYQKDYRQNHKEKTPCIIQCITKTTGKRKGQFKQGMKQNQKPKRKKENTTNNEKKNTKVKNNFV